MKLLIDKIATAQGINKHQLHLKAGVSWPKLLRYWNNKSGNFDAVALSRIASVLGVTMQDLIEDDASELVAAETKVGESHTAAPSDLLAVREEMRQVFASLRAELAHVANQQEEIRAALARYEERSN